MKLLGIVAVLLRCIVGPCPAADTGAEPPTTTTAGVDLKPGFYEGGDPDIKKLDECMARAKFRIVLSGHNGISIGGEDKLSMERARALADAVKEKRLALIEEEKNFTDDAVEKTVQEMLKDAGFQEVLTTGMNTFGIRLLGYAVHAKTQAAAEAKKFYVGTAADPEKWPYRYTLVRDAAGWSGEIEYGSLFFDKMTVVKGDPASDKIRFFALYGGPGKALPMSWELTLKKSDAGYEGVLVAVDPKDGFEPVKLNLLEKAEVVMPSSEVQGKVLGMDDANYRSDEALRHEVEIAKQAWEKEAVVAARIAELRADDEMRKGVRREWVGPLWVKERLKPEEAKYFERICCVYLGGTAVSDEDLKAICGLTELRELFLHRTAVSDAGLEDLGHLQMLRVLHLGNTMVTSESIEKLKTLVNLEELYLNDTGIPDADGQRLQLMLPKVKVRW